MRISLLPAATSSNSFQSSGNANWNLAMQHSGGIDVSSRLCDNSAMTDRDTITQLCEQLATALLAKRLTLASAESCTGGLIAKTCTDLAGSSQWFEAAIVSYSNASKQRLLGVSADLIAAHGAVSEAVVVAMLQGLFACTDADLGIAVSGIAGPGGGSVEKPVGTVWLSYGLRNQQVQSELLRLDGTRAEIREKTLEIAIKALIKIVND
jgi:nicotinamide-nucleotide amidase